MKKLILPLFFILVLAFSVFAGLDVQLKSASISNPLSVDLESGESANKLVLTVVNTGNETVNNIKGLAVFSDLKDSDDNLVSILNPLPITTLTAGQSANLVFNFDVDSGFHPETLTGTLTITADGMNATNYGLNLNVKPAACQPNAEDKINLDINNPESGDEYSSGDTVNVDLDVENNDNNDLTMKVTAFLYNLDKDKKISSYTIRKSINEDDSRNFRFSLDLGEIKDSNARLYVKVYDDDDELNNCQSEDIKLDVVVPDHKITINNPSLSTLTATCGNHIEGSALLKNVGDNDETVTFDTYSTSSQWALNVLAQTVYLDSSNNVDDNSKVVNFAFDVPKTLKDGTYPIMLRSKYSGELTLSQLNLNLQGCGAVSQQTTVTTVPVTTSDNSLVTTGTGVYTQKSLFDSFNNNGSIPTSVWILIDALVAVLIIVCLVWLFRSR